MGGSSGLPAGDMADSQMRRPERLDGLKPVVVARRLRHLPGLVLFDTAGHLPGSGGPAVSLIAARPLRELCGNIAAAGDQAALRAAVTGGPQVAEATGFPMGGLCGWVDYEGDFVFGEYREMLVYCHDDETWRELGRLSECLETPLCSGETPIIGPFSALTTRDGFIAGVHQIKEWISAGANWSGGALDPPATSIRQTCRKPIERRCAEARYLASTKPCAWPRRHRWPPGCRLEGGSC